MGLPSSVIKAAIHAAEKSQHRHRLGAVVFKGKRILGVGYNGVGRITARRSVPNSVTAGYWPDAIHAELAAILNAGTEDCRRASILVVRLNKAGELIMSRPCKTCMGVIAYVGIRKIFYTTSGGDIILTSVPVLS